MKIEFSETAKAQLDYWKRKDKRILRKIRSLLEAIMEQPYSGIGKPEPLKHQFQGYWSRRINREHRLVYKIEENRIIVASCRFHYQ